MDTIKITPYSGIKLLLLALVLFCAKANAQVVPFGMLHSDRDTETEIVEIVSATTGRIWMDRNLGASQVAANSTDHLAYGDLYQWGRGADGHETIVWTSASGSNNAEQNNIKQGPVDLGSEGNHFIKSQGDWLTTQDDNRWNTNQTSGGAAAKAVNDPCPSGFRIPIKAEWEAEIGGNGITNDQSAWEILKLTMAGWREYQDGGISNTGLVGRYWSSSTKGTNAEVLFTQSTVSFNGRARSYGYSVRCIKE